MGEEKVFERGVPSLDEADRAVVVGAARVYANAVALEEVGNRLGSRAHGAATDEGGDFVTEGAGRLPEEAVAQEGSRLLDTEVALAIVVEPKHRLVEGLG